MVTTTSGGIRMTNVVGDLRAASVSGGISGRGLARISDARSMSGGIDLTSDFAADAQIVTRQWWCVATLDTGGIGPC